MSRVVVIGAGPAGAAAAMLLTEHGIAVTVIDEADRPGGQVWRTPVPGLALDMDRLLGAEMQGFRHFHAAFEALLPRIDWRPRSAAWNIQGRTVLLESGGAQQTLPYDALVLATGATDRIAPIPGWTLPGVYALGGAQTVLKAQGCLIGAEVAFCGSSPLLYLAARQYARFGARVTVLDTTPFAAKRAALRDLAAAPGTLMKGIGHILALRRAGAAMHHGVTLLGFEGETSLRALRWRDRRGAEHTLRCDAAAYGHGLRPETQLTELAGCAMRYDAVQRQWFPEVDAMGRAGDDVYVAGDGVAIGGAVAAALSGRLAAMALLADRGIARDPGELPALLARERRFQRGIARAFAWPHAAIATLDNATPICRCENITAGEVRAALAVTIGADEVNRMKAATRCGMGRCQGRFCGAAAAELTAATLGRADAPLDRLRAQAPVKPLALASAAVETDWP